MIVTINNQKIFLKTANNFKTRLIGLIGKKKIENGLIFYNCSSIHTFFMKDNIDIVFLDKNFKIIQLCKNVKKNKIIIEMKAKHTLELPKGYIEYLSLQINETLNQLIKL